MESAQELFLRYRRDVALALAVGATVWTVKALVELLLPATWAKAKLAARYIWYATNRVELVLVLCALLLVAVFRIWRRYRWTPVVRYSPIVRIEGLKWRRVVPASEVPPEFIERCLVEFLASNPRKTFSMLDMIRRLKITKIQADRALFGLAARKLLSVREGKGELRYKLNESGKDYAAKRCS